MNYPSKIAVMWQIFLAIRVFLSLSYGFLASFVADYHYICFGLFLRMWWSSVQDNILNN